MLHGIDISKYQGAVNFDALKSEIDFVIMKATEGSPDPGQTVVQYEDGMFKRNQAEARRVGILRGYYHFARPDYNDAAPEAEEFVNAIGGLQENEVMFLDFEQATKKDIPTWCKQWLDKVEQLTGCKPLIYLNESLVNSHDWSQVLAGGYGLWIAKYGSNDGHTVSAVNTGIWPTAAFYQYTSTAIVGAIHPVDADNFYGDAAAFDRYGYHAEQPAPAPEPAPAPAPEPPAPEVVTAPVDNTEQLKIDDLTNRNSALQSQIDQNQADLKKAADSMAAVQQQLTEITAESNDLTDLNASLVAQNDSLKAELSKYSAVQPVPFNLQSLIESIINLFKK